ncbi:phosphotransferase family protein [Cohnella sp. REN36]|uniref:phosphotransferase family protein n=1 Tax=Cohnella sp. REN36 TaxID=2887347 RepID=UPI001D1333B6|nr:phosphotransferase [Cohnella sp. REN36]MCC3376093.1 aminoglycoside phosphotransferase family protein [Cohnella sp. REN36]
MDRSKGCDWAGAGELLGPDGRLDERRIVRRETLYRGMNGCEVERLYGASGECVIRKPPTNDSHAGAEAWVYENVLPALPPIYPRLLACSPSGEPGSSWTLFEDLGSLDHAFGEEAVLALVPHIARWHSLPTGALRGAPLRGPKPGIERMAADLRARLEAGEDHAEEGAPLLANVSPALVRRTVEMTGQPAWAEEMARDAVFSHGDLHLGNYAMTAAGIKAIDWEHAHLNSRYWDLYHVLDMSHPLFPKPVDAGIRRRVLERYVAEAAAYGGPLQLPAFARGYARFAAVFSLWMLLLIEGDLAAGGGPWPLERLRLQREEARLSFEQNAAACADEGMTRGQIREIDG